MTTLSLSHMCQRLAVVSLFFFAIVWRSGAQSIDVTQRLDGFDAYMAKTLKDWNAPGVGVGIVVNDKPEVQEDYLVMDRC